MATDEFLIGSWVFNTKDPSKSIIAYQSVLTRQGSKPAQLALSASEFTHGKIT